MKGSIFMRIVGVQSQLESGVSNFDSVVEIFSASSTASSKEQTWRLRRGTLLLLLILTIMNRLCFQKWMNCEICIIIWNIKKINFRCKKCFAKKMRLKILTKWKTVSDSFPALQSSVATLPASHVGIDLRGEWPAGSVVMSNAGRKDQTGSMANLFYRRYVCVSILVSWQALAHHSATLAPLRGGLDKKSTIQGSAATWG